MYVDNIFSLQVKYQGPGGVEFTFTTDINIIPDDLPFAPCEGVGCYGTLV